ncbi:CBS domain-containing protein [Gallaecimonas kandeliae]|uniref:CBS domain-containing protein n=1 Tax=Gallaecimonas kandeliae TaxID=3029055 RepID=UPI002648AB34|nr:CBS domain-containing protein [Gallaecimonas kandeliae]WKE66812.1 CBS domain-containing protein [Gallaecimonas kandeliae]
MESLIIRDHMQRHPLSLHPDMSIATAVEKLLLGEQTGAPVVDSENHLVGFVSEQDFLAKLMESSYHCELVAKVSDVMRADVLTVGPNDSVFELAQQMTGQKPKIYPVVEEGKLIGIINRRQVLLAMDKHLHECYKAS